MKRTIRLKESELKRMISESVRRVLNEDIDDMQPKTPVYIDILNLGVGVKKHMKNIYGVMQILKWGHGQ